MFQRLSPGPPATVEKTENANQRLAAALQADAVWNVDRVLRPPGTFNRKHAEPVPVIWGEGWRERGSRSPGAVRGSASIDHRAPW